MTVGDRCGIAECNLPRLDDDIVCRDHADWLAGNGGDEAEMEAENQWMKATLARIADLHREDDGWCAEDGFDWPCRTVRAVHSDKKAAQ